MNIADRKLDIIKYRKMSLIVSIAFLCLVWFLAFVAKSPDMITLAISGTFVSVIYNLFYRFTSKREYDKLTKISKSIKDI